MPRRIVVIPGVATTISLGFAFTLTSRRVGVVLY
jgi:hypothetical protein